MNKSIVISILLGIAVTVSISLLLIPENPSQIQSKPIYEMSFTYYDVETIKTSLAKHDIFMSTPTAITDNTIEQYCTFFDDENIQRSVEYCITIALLDSGGKSFGNINMGGTTDGPFLPLLLLMHTLFRF